MRTIGIHTRVASLVGAVALLIQISPALATDQDDHNRPVEITFTKWGVTAPPLPAPQPPFGLLEGFAGDGPVGSFVGEVLWRQASLNGHVTGLEAMYEVVDGDRSFTALIRGGQNAAGAAHFDGVILAGWRTGARVQVVFQRYLAIAGMPSCEGAPVNKNVFRGNHPRRARPAGLNVRRARHACVIRRLGCSGGSPARQRSREVKPAITSHRRGTRRFSSSNQFCTKII